MFLSAETQHVQLNNRLLFDCLLGLEKPREFLLEQLKVLQQSGVTGPNLFDNTNLEAVFRILDPTNQAYITFAQYKQGERRTLHNILNKLSHFRTHYLLVI